MPSTPAVSIVVIVRNGMPYIREAMESLTRQDCMDFEVIVQDAASTDGTTEYLNTICGLDIHIDSRPDRGQAHAYNRGFGKARGEDSGNRGRRQLAGAHRDLDGDTRVRGEPFGRRVLRQLQHGRGERQVRRGAEVSEVRPHGDHSEHAGAAVRGRLLHQGDLRRGAGERREHQALPGFRLLAPAR